MPHFGPLVLRTIHSLLGVLPLGLTVLLVSAALGQLGGGRESVSPWLKYSSTVPWLLAEAGLIYIPLLLHAAYGLKLAASRSYNLARYSAANNWLYSLQRVTGPIILFWITAHLWLFRYPVVSGRLRPEDVTDEASRLLSATTEGGVPLMLILYLVGAAALSFHLGHGLQRVAFSFGLVRGPNVTRLNLVCGALGASLYLWLSHVIFLVGTGVGLSGGWLLR